MHKKCKKELWKQVSLPVCIRKQIFILHRLLASCEMVPIRLFELIHLVALKSVEKKLIYSEVTTQC